MFVTVAKAIARLGVYAVGLAAVIGTWDFTQQAKAADYSYTFNDYRLSVADRLLGAENGYAASAYETARAGFRSGAAWMNASDVAGNVGLESDEVANVSARKGSRVAARGAAPVVLASADATLAPEVSLFPRARTPR